VSLMVREVEQETEVEHRIEHTLFRSYAKSIGGNTERIDLYRHLVSYLVFKQEELNKVIASAQSSSDDRLKRRKLVLLKAPPSDHETGRLCIGTRLRLDLGRCFTTQPRQVESLECDADSGKALRKSTVTVLISAYLDEERLNILIFLKGDPCLETVLRLPRSVLPRLAEEEGRDDDDKTPTGKSSKMTTKLPLSSVPCGINSKEENRMVIISFLDRQEREMACKAVKFACRSMSLKMVGKQGLRAIKSKHLERLSVTAIQQEGAATAIQSRVRGIQTRMRNDSLTTPGAAILSEAARRLRDAAFKRAWASQRIRTRRRIAQTARSAAVRRLTSMKERNCKEKSQFLVESRLEKEKRRALIRWTVQQLWKQGTQHPFVVSEKAGRQTIDDEKSEQERQQMAREEEEKRLKELQRVQREEEEKRLKELQRVQREEEEKRLKELQRVQREEEEKRLKELQRVQREEEEKRLKDLQRVQEEEETKALEAYRAAAVLVIQCAIRQYLSRRTYSHLCAERWAEWEAFYGEGGGADVEEYATGKDGDSQELVQDGEGEKVAGESEEEGDSDESEYEEEQVVVDPQVRKAFSLARHGRRVQLCELLSTGLDPNCRMHGKTLLHESVLNNRKPLVTLLDDFGADVNAVGPRGFTALHYACKYGYSTLCDYMITKLGADETILNDDGCSCFQLTCPNQLRPAAAERDAWYSEV